VGASATGWNPLTLDDSLMLLLIPFTILNTFGYNKQRTTFIMSGLSTRVLSGYRRLFRARKSLFVGDDRAMRESRLAIRSEFDKHRHVTDPAHLEGLLVMVDEAEDMLLHGIVRGELNRERNTYEIKIKKEHAESMDKETITHMDPITAETSCNESEKPDVVVVTASKSSNRHEN
jgi:complex III assembly factor LYRM7